MSEQNAKAVVGTAAKAKVGRNMVDVVIEEDLGGGRYRVRSVGSGKTFESGRVEIPAPAPKPKKVSLVGAALEILGDGKPRTAAELAREAQERGLWQAGKGKTPSLTLYSAIVREIASSPNPRFRRAEGRGCFSAAR